jgi:hypothetical protein
MATLEADPKKSGEILDRFVWALIHTKEGRKLRARMAPILKKGLGSGL